MPADEIDQEAEYESQQQNDTAKTIQELYASGKIDFSLEVLEGPWMSLKVLEGSLSVLFDGTLTSRTLKTLKVLQCTFNAPSMYFQGPSRTFKVVQGPFKELQGPSRNFKDLQCTLKVH